MTTTTGQCFHCGEALPARPVVASTEDAIAFCCEGCRAVHDLLHQEGLEAFYGFREGPAPRPPEALSETERAQLAEYDDPLLQERLVQTGEEGRLEATLLLEGLRCGACVWLIENHLGRLDGVHRFEVNQSTCRARVSWDPAGIRLSEILEALKRLGFGARPYSPDAAETQRHREQRQSLIRLCIAGIGTMQSMMLAMPLYFGLISGVSPEMIQFFRWVSLAVATPVVLVSARPFFVNAWRDLRVRHLTMDVPVALAIGLAYLASAWITFFGGREVYFDAVCMFTFFLTLGRYLEQRARYQSGLLQADITSALPATARQVEGDGTRLVPASQLSPGDRIRVRPGETVPVDGCILDGQSHLDESALTGEYQPLSRGPGEAVIAGSVNGPGPLDIRVVRPAGATRLNSMLRLLDQAEAEKPRVALLANRVAAGFVAAVLLISAAVFTFHHLQGTPGAFEILLSVLVVTCPCALSLATPAALTSASLRLRKLGFLPTRGHTLETLARIDTLVFDKTGTLTLGKLHLRETRTADGVEPDQARQWAAALEAHSEHPIARAFAGIPELPAENLRNHPGAGLEGRVAGQTLWLGSASLLDSIGVEPPAMDAADGGSWIHLANARRWLASFCLDDEPRPESAKAISALRSQGYGLAILSGDQWPAARRMAQRLGIDKVRAGASPEDKLAFLRELEQSGQAVMMVGDGLNDLPVMAGARLAVAMGGGADLTRVRADAILLRNDPGVLPQALNLAHRARRVIRQNLGWALAYNLVALPAAAAGLVPPWLAALGMSASSLIVVLNALRLQRSNPGGESRPRPARPEPVPAAGGL